MIRIIQTHKGAALVITLAVIAVVVMAGLQLHWTARKSAKAVLVEKDLFQAEQIAMSGIQLARIILTDDAQKNSIDSVQEVWADSEKLSEAVQALGIEKDTLQLAIIDELSKIQVNALIKEFPGNRLNADQVTIWERMTTLEPFKEMMRVSIDAVQVINPLKDWLDSGDDDRVTGISGAESEYYQNLDPPYTCANGPLNHISQLLWIKGFSPGQPEPERASVPGETTKKYEYSDFFTVYGMSDTAFQYPGKVNINTAPVEVIRALLPEGLQSLAEEIESFRLQKSETGQIYIHPLEKGWVKEAVAMDPEQEKELDRVIQYSSHYFKVICQVSQPTAQGRWIAYLKREKSRLTGNWTVRVTQIQRK